MILASWTYDKMSIDYFPYSEVIGTRHCLDNEGWRILGTKGLVFSNWNHFSVSVYAHFRKYIIVSCQMSVCTSQQTTHNIN